MPVRYRAICRGIWPFVQRAGEGARSPAEVGSRTGRFGASAHISGRLFRVWVADACAPARLGACNRRPSNVFAGTGKTTTLRLLSEASGGRGLYLAFNRSIAEGAKAKFPKNTTCSTIHSIAFRATSQAYRREDKMTAAMNANAVASHLGYSDLVVDGVRLTPRSRGYLTLETLDARGGWRWELDLDRAGDRRPMARVPLIRAWLSDHELNVVTL